MTYGDAVHRGFFSVHRGLPSVFHGLSHRGLFHRGLFDRGLLHRGHSPRGPPVASTQPTAGAGAGAGADAAGADGAGIGVGFDGVGIENNTNPDSKTGTEKTNDDHAASTFNSKLVDADVEIIADDVVAVAESFEHSAAVAAFVVVVSITVLMKKMTYL